MALPGDAYEGQSMLMRCRQRMLTMTNIPAFIDALQPEDLAILRQRGPNQVLDRAMVHAFDHAAGGPGVSRGSYVVSDRLEPLAYPNRRRYYLREDVAAAVLAARLEGASGAGS